MKPSSPLFQTLFAALLSLSSTAAFSSATAADPGALLEEIRDSRLDLAAAVSVQNLRVSTGMAILEITEGIVIPTTSPGERAVEMIFLGRGRLLLKPPDAIEAGQLELFTGNERLDEEIEAAVLVVALDGAADALLKRPLATEIEPTTAQRAEDLFQRWRASPERRLLNIEGTLLADALGDPFYEGYFAGWLHGTEIGKFLYVSEPSEFEQITLGQFVELEATEKEKRRLRRKLHKQQGQGRLMGLEVEDLGTWDTWVSTSLRTAEAKPQPGRPAFVAKHYELETRLSNKDLHLSGHARLHLEASSNHGRVARLTSNSNLEITRVKAIETGQDLFFHSSKGELLVVFPEPPMEGSITVIEVEYHGRLVEKSEGKTYVLSDTTHWYPHCGELELATYDLQFEWPKGLELVSSGEKVEGGIRPGGALWEKRRLDIPSFAVSFEIGRYRTLTRQAGHVSISLSLDVEFKSYLKADQERLLETLANSLTFFEETFGPYPLDHLVAVTAPRDFSQSLLGFVTLSSVMMMDEEGLMSLFFGFEDPRTVIAHEVAHQWWGHIVCMKSYREQWLTESMANFSAILFARKKLWVDGQRSLVGPTTGWQAEMVRRTLDERTIESLGPLTLGHRLSSSLVDGAYDSIVYKKGAVVVDMLSRSFGEENFLTILKAANQHLAQRPTSTELFLNVLEKLSGTDLGPFADQFIYSTGLPEIYYDYRFEAAAEGWNIHLSAQQQSPVKNTYEIIERSGGRFDISRQVEARIDTSDSALAVPLRIVVWDPSKADRKNRRAKEKGGPLVGPAFPSFLTHRLFQGDSTELDLAVPLEPLEVRLDPDQEVFGRFFNSRRNPKRVLLYRAGDKMDAQKGSEALLLYQEALVAEVRGGSQGEAQRPSKEIREEGKFLNALIHMGIARLYLDEDRTEDARASLAQASQLVDRDAAAALRGRLRTLESRAALLEGKPEEAFKILQKTFLKRNRLYADAHSSLLLAIAAHQTGRHKEKEAAIARATARGGDASRLTSR